MVSLLPGERDLLKEPLLERLCSKLRRRQEYCRALGPLSRASQKLVAVVRPEIRVVPVAFEDCGHLLDYVSIAGRRDADVPLKPANLRRVRQVGRAYVSRRKP